MFESVKENILEISGEHLFTFSINTQVVLETCNILPTLITYYCVIYIYIQIFSAKLKRLQVISNSKKLSRSCPT